MKEKTNTDYWLNVLSNLPKSYKIWFEEEKRYLQETITNNAKVLEVGCGDGRSIFDILPMTKHITGIDHNDTAVTNAISAFKDYPTIKLLKADATELPFSDEAFDFVICMTTFANFADNKYLVINEMKRVLKNNGKIIISVFSEDALEERLKLYEMLGVKIRSINNGNVTFDELNEDNVSEQFTAKELEDIFFDSDLKIDRMHRVNIAYLCTLRKRY